MKKSISFIIFLFIEGISYGLSINPATGRLDRVGDSISTTTLAPYAILNQNSLQSGSTYYTSSGTANSFTASTISVNVKIQVPVGDDYGTGNFNSRPQYSFIDSVNWGWYKHPSENRYTFTYGDGANSMYEMDRTYFAPGLNVTMDLGDVTGGKYWKTLYSQNGVFTQNVTIGTTLTVSGLGLNDCVGSNSDGMLITGTCTGGGASLIIATGPVTGNTGPATSTQTLTLLLDSSVFLGQLLYGGTFYARPNPSSVTLQGQGVLLSTQGYVPWSVFQSSMGGSAYLPWSVFITTTPQTYVSFNFFNSSGATTNIQKTSNTIVYFQLFQSSLTQNNGTGQLVRTVGATIPNSILDNSSVTKNGQPTGAPDGTKFLGDDWSWQVAPGGSSLIITTGPVTGNTGPATSTKTLTLLLDNSAFLGQLLYGGTFYARPNPSSVTLQGQGVLLSTQGYVPWANFNSSGATTNIQKTSNTIAYLQNIGVVLSTMSENYFRLKSTNIVSGMTQFSSVTVNDKFIVRASSVWINGVTWTWPSFTAVTSTGVLVVSPSSGITVAPAFTEYYEYIEFGSPDHIPVTSSVTFETSAATSPAYGKAHYQHAVSSQFNESIFYSDMLRTYDNAVDMRLENFSVMIGSTTDTGSMRFIVDVSSFANGAALSTARWTNAATVDIPADASGAAFDVEASTTIITLTGWKTAVVTGAPFAIRVARDGDATNDSSTQKCYLRRFKIRFAVTNP